MSSTFFAYHLTHHFGAFSLNGYHTNSDKPQENDSIYVVSGDDSDEGGKDYSLEGVFRLHRRESGPFPMQSLKGETKNYQYRLKLRPVRVPDAPIPMANADWYDKADIHRFFSSGQNFNPIPPVYQQRFDNLLAGFALANESEMASDLAELVSRTDVDPTTRAALVQARVGQGKFRSDLTRLWELGERCFLTALDVPELLVASHIKPWRDSNDRERLDPHNGLLLAAHADKLFDRYLMSFEYAEDEFRCVLHRRVVAVAKILGIVAGRPLTTTKLNLGNTREIQRYMGEHYKEFCRRIADEIPEDERDH
jgi:HNH endonuclease